MNGGGGYRFRYFLIPSLAELYDPNTQLLNLLKAHHQLVKASMLAMAKPSYNLPL